MSDGTNDVDVETTRAEIVDVIVNRTTHRELADCIVEGSWGTTLPDADWPDRETHPLRFG